MRKLWVLALLLAGCGPMQAQEPTVENVAIQGGYVTGEVLNDSDRRYTQIGVVFSVLDAAGNPTLAEDTNDQTAEIAPHTRWRFHCPLFGAPVASCHLKTLVYF